MRADRAMDPTPTTTLLGGLPATPTPAWMTCKEVCASSGGARKPGSCNALSTRSKRVGL